MKHDKFKQDLFEDKVRDLPKVEAAWAGIPELILSPGSTKEKPIVIDKRYYNREYMVKDGEIYTIRVGLHSHPAGLGAFTRDSTGVAILPTISSKTHVVAGMFSQREIYPIIYMDSIYLSADEPFRLELLYGSAALECNSGKGRIPLGGEAVSLEDGLIIISQSDLREKLPDYYTYTYDFITFQVRVVFEDGCLLTDAVSRNSDNDDWSSRTEAKVGDELDFWISYENNSNQTQEDIAIALEFPQSLKFLSGSVDLYGCDTTNGESSFEITDPSSIQIKHCAPGGEVYIDYRAEVTDILPEGETPVWKWTEVRVGQKIIQSYSEVIVKK